METQMTVEGRGSLAQGRPFALIQVLFAPEAPPRKAKNDA
jgi:hypothetical protein